MTAYEPFVDELTPEERAFLARLAPSGVDWRTCRREFALRFGISKLYGWADVITLPATDALTDDALAFHMYAEADVMDLPPEYLFTYVMPFDDARANHHHAERQLTERLGPPALQDSSNALVRRWGFGAFSVDLHSFPPELQGPWAAKNELHAREPRLATASLVGLHSAYACALPDRSLLPVTATLAARHGGSAAAPALFFGVQASEATGESPTLPISRRYSRRNPHALSAALPAGRLAAWRDEAGGRCGLSDARTSLVLPRDRMRALTLVRIAPARGPGGSELVARVAPAVRNASNAAGGDGVDRVTLLSADRPDALDTPAAALAHLFVLPLDSEDTCDV